MKKKLIIFGLGQVAELAYYYFKNDSNYDVIAFTVDEQYIISHSFCGLPVVSFEMVTNKYSPEDHDLFVALGYSKLNSLRIEKYNQAKDKKYFMPSYISSRATILNEGLIGDNCFILENNTIQPFVKIGNNVTLWSGNHIGHHSIIHDHNFIASHVVVSGGVEIEESCFLGVNSTIRNHIKISKQSIIGAGTLILNEVECYGLYKGLQTERSNISSLKLKNI